MIRTYSMNKIRLIAVDLDGTLLDSSKSYPADFPLWVKRHPEIITVIASGRQYYKLREQFKEIENDIYYVAENGGAVYSPQGELLYSDSMSNENYLEAVSKSVSLPYSEPVICGIKSAYIRKSANAGAVALECRKYYSAIEIVDSFECIDDRILKIAVYIPSRAKSVYGSIADPEHIAPGVTAVLSGDDWIDIGKSECCKGNGIRFLQKRLDIRPSESAAFGDFINDLSMFDCCDMSFAMANALPEVRKCARYITDKTNEEGGVMDSIRKHIAL